ncbi:Phosphatidylinositol N-acetylglucosaminyltransferase subunit H [Rhynchospora pubera]|uniref:Phosphatidylinositol N-acetylglucosaminyltransferase subunit H n=1 Tax=Rhynchospora pubera TaxID=906938 RepID=A0AAV8HVD8_9POAL|nr:Phosphatidylinositol N-acetylglucosaminyltransferase subunit H [Rhynchospora pubera]
MKNGRDSRDTYKYVRSDSSALDKVIDVHDVFVKRSKLRVFFSYIGRLILLANLLLLIIEKDKSSIGSFWRLFLGVVSTKLLQYKPIKKESVVIMPSFGVQLETHYWSGRIDRKFIPMGNILKPVLNECVTPVTCYWSLALVLRDEDQLTLVFQKLRPPIKILVPVWEALCKSTNLEDHSHSLK